MTASTCVVLVCRLAGCSSCAPGCVVRSWRAAPRRAPWCGRHARAAWRGGGQVALSPGSAEGQPGGACGPPGCGPEAPPQARMRGQRSCPKEGCSLATSTRRCGGEGGCGQGLAVEDSFLKLRGAHGGPRPVWHAVLHTGPGPVPQPLERTCWTPGCSARRGRRHPCTWVVEHCARLRVGQPHRHPGPPSSSARRRPLTSRSCGSSPAARPLCQASHRSRLAHPLDEVLASSCTAGIPGRRSMTPRPRYGPSGDRIPAGLLLTDRRQILGGRRCGRCGAKMLERGWNGHPSPLDPQRPHRPSNPTNSPSVQTKQATDTGP
jgi:hypothetical protein